MVFLPFLLALLAAADASSSTVTYSCFVHHARTRSGRERFPPCSPSLPCRSHGIVSRRWDPSSLRDQHDRIATRMEGIVEGTPHYLPASSSPIETTRRAVLFQIISLTALSSAFTDPSSASEIDTTGQLFSPKNEMIKGGGSAAARGIPLKPMDQKESRKRNNQSLLKSTGLIQNVYETRFITYLARFLLVFDPAASAWWRKNSKPKMDDESNTMAQQKFAEFAESVEVGLADYFTGPYGSYGSVAAAKAGLAAAEPAKSVGDAWKDTSLWDAMFSDRLRGTGSDTQAQLMSSTAKRKKSRKAGKEALDSARQGILNLLSLLRARYTSTEEKSQLAILFSLISKPELQPVQEIRGFLGEVDNGTVAEIELVDISTNDDEETAASSRDDFRLSSRRGGGFSKNDQPVIRVEPPAPYGDEYKPAKIQAVMKPTTRILRINVADGGQGYTAAPDVIIRQRGVSRQCEACAIIDRNGSVSEVLVLNPGFGYGGGRSRQGEPTLPTVEIRERKILRKKKSKVQVKPAKAVPELEYKVVGANIVDPGSGYLFDRPPEVSLDLPPVDPDWFGKPVVFSRSPNTEEDEQNQLMLASISKMKSGTDGFVVDTRAARTGKPMLEDVTLRSIQNDPVALLPSNTRPQFSKFTDDASLPRPQGKTERSLRDDLRPPDVIENGYYSIKSLPESPPDVALPSSNYRSIDIFGGIGKAPVTKNALTLSSSQYFRLALAGAICTVLVRTALNPLELVKTKIQLGNDKEIIGLAMEKSVSKQQSPSASKPAIGTAEVIQSLVEVRGPLSLFQSADITFITSVVFGLFGFGATELFRRSFAIVFFDEASSGSNQFLFLLAAGLATLLTCAAGAPFEILRVRSMSTTENQDVQKVFSEFMEQNRPKQAIPVASTLSLSSTSLANIKPLWSSFNPIVARELPFACTKFLVFDLVATSIAEFINDLHVLDDSLQVGVGTLGLLLSAFAGALAGIAGAFVSHPADLILTLTSASSREKGAAKDWEMIVRELLDSDGGILNLFVGFPARAAFFFLVIGLQFFLYDFTKAELGVGTDDLTLVLDVFYAVRQGLP